MRLRYASPRAPTVCGAGMPDGRLDTGGRLSLEALHVSQPVSMKPRTSATLRSTILPMPDSIFELAVMIMRCTGACASFWCSIAIHSHGLSFTLLMPTLEAIMMMLPSRGWFSASRTQSNSLTVECATPPTWPMAVMSVSGGASSFTCALSWPRGVAPPSVSTMREGSHSSVSLEMPVVGLTVSGTIHPLARLIERRTLPSAPRLSMNSDCIWLRS